MNHSVRSIAMITSIAFSLPNFRGPLVRRLVESGIKVYALAPDFDDSTRSAVRDLGAEPIDIQLDRTGLRPFRDLSDSIQLARLLRRLKPDLTFAYFIKPVIFGTFAARFAGVRQRYALVAGLGYAFTPDSDQESFKRRALRIVASVLYFLAFRLCRRVFLQNSDDCELLCDRGLLPRAKAVLISGSGVDLRRFSPVTPVSRPITFILVARLLREKGIVEYVDAARRIKSERPDVRFFLVGDFDLNPGGLQRDKIERWVVDGLVEWPGQVADVRQWLAQSSVFVLPSYREGKPRSTQEAMAMGLPVITTDAPGCRDTVVDGVNGFQVGVRDARALATAMQRFVDHPEILEPMGRESRRMAEEMFDVDRINSVLMQEMGLEVSIASEETLHSAR